MSDGQQTGGTYRCASSACPGYSFKASDRPHPWSTCGSAPLPAVSPERRPLRTIIYDMLTEHDEAQGEAMPLLDALEGELASKVDAYAAVYRMLMAEAKANKQVAAELAEPYKRKAEALDNRADWLREHMREQMQRLGVEQLKGGVSKAFVHRSVSVQVDEDKFEMTERNPCVRIALSPDKAAIKNEIENGKEVPGAWLEARTRVDFK